MEFAPAGDPSVVYLENLSGASIDQAVAVRDSKDPAGPVLTFTSAEWVAFVNGAKDGQFEL
jgi:hypothetical protein